jgi:hypothetical protein
MSDVMGWGTIMTVLAIPIVFAWVGFSMRRRQRWMRSPNLRLAGFSASTQDVDRR